MERSPISGKLPAGCIDTPSSQTDYNQHAFVGGHHRRATNLDSLFLLTPEEQHRLSVVLVASRNPLNIGAAARAMSNFGFPHLRVVHPYEAAFREARSAVDAEPVLTAAEEFKQTADAIADCSLVVGTTGGARRQMDEPLATLEQGAELVRAALRSGSRVAVLFGSEKVGLSNQDLSHCQLLLRIPTRTDHPSMNLGQAVAVVLYELARETKVAAATASDPQLATAAERERLIALLLEALSFGGLAHPAPHAERAVVLMDEKLRGLVRRLSLTSPDLHQWLGLVRQILWKLQHPNTPPPQE
jgi:tRNA/rRNA methyltransferase